MDILVNGEDIMEFLIHNFGKNGICKWGLNFNIKDREFILKLPLPFIRYSIWCDFETYNTFRGLRLLTLYFYIRFRKGFKKNIISDISLWWRPTIKKFIGTKKDFKNYEFEKFKESFRFPLTRC